MKEGLKQWTKNRYPLEEWKTDNTNNDNKMQISVTGGLL